MITILNNIVHKLSYKYIKWLVFFILAFVFIVIDFENIRDFTIYYKAAKNLFELDNLYQPFYTEKYLKYLGTPILTLLVYPLSKLPLLLVGVIMKSLSLLALLRSWELICKYFEIEEKVKQLKTTWFFLSIMVTIFLIYDNMHMVQFTIIMLYLSIEGLFQIERNNNFFGAILISLAVLIKITPIVILPYLVYRGYFKASIILLLTIISCYFIPSLFLGWEKNSFLWYEWYNGLGSANGFFDDNNRKNQGLSSLIPSLLIENYKDNVTVLAYRRHLFDLNSKWVEYILHVSRLLLVLGTLYVLRTKPFQKSKNKMHTIWELSYLFLIIPLFFPQQRSYNFFFLFPAIVYLLYQFRVNKTQIKYYKTKLFLFIISTLVLNIELLFGVYRKIYWHYKTLAYASLFLLVLLLILKPSFKEDRVN